MDVHVEQQSVKNKKRRTILTFGVLAVVTFILGKLFGENDSFLFPVSKGPVKETQFSNFKITESKDEMTLSDKSGEPIFIVDKASFR